MDGRTIDEGAAFELGYAFALGKACVGLKTDARSLFTFGDNPMIEGAVREIFHDETSLCRWLEEYNLAH
jgi:nucleoside 2-deoxyribosyltransferase